MGITKVAAWLSVAGIIAASVPAGAADPELYFSKTARVPLGTAPLVFGPRDTIDFTLNFRTPSLAARDRLPLLTIDDWRFDVRKKGGIPNVTFDVMEIRKGADYQPASYKVSTEGDRQLDGLYLTANVVFLLGRSQPVYWLTDHFGGLSHVMERHWEGTYRIRAHYRESTSPPILVTVR